MANVLEKIVADKRIEVEQLKIDKPLSSFIDSRSRNFGGAPLGKRNESELTRLRKRRICFSLSNANVSRTDIS